MRKNYRKKIFSFLLICITLSSIPTIQEVGVSGTPNSPLSSNSINSSEFDTIDSFDVHPLNRWDVINDDSDIDSVVVSDGLLNISDTGDGSSDYYILGRELRSSDGTIDVRVKFSSNYTSGSFSDAFALEMDTAIGSDIFNVWFGFISNAGTTGTSIRYIDIAGDTQSLDMIGSEDVASDEWIIIRFDYNLLESKFRVRVYYENMTKVLDYDYYDVGIVLPQIFSRQTPRIKLVHVCNTNTKNIITLIDYIKAPFKEREWTQTTAPVDSDYVQDGVEIAHAQDDISDQSIWQIVIPDLDSVAGYMRHYIIDADDMLGDEFVQTNFYLYAVDADDGELHQIINIQLKTNLENATPDQYLTTVEVFYDVINQAGRDFLTDTAKPYEANPAAQFSIGIRDDGDKVDLQCQAYSDEANADGFVEILASIDVSDIVDDLSTEFVLSIRHNFFFTSDIDAYSIVNDINIIERGEFSGREQPIVPANSKTGAVGGGIFGWLGGIFLTAIRALGNFLAPFFAILGEIITNLGAAILVGIIVLQNALEDAIGFVVDAIEDIQGWLVTLGGVIEDAIGLIQGWIEDIINNFIAGAQEFIEAILLGLLNLLADVWNFITGSIFFLWDILGWPDLLAIIATGLEGIIEIIIGAPAFILEVINDWILPFVIIIICLYWLWVLFLAFAEETFEPFAGFSNFFDRLTTVYNFTILGVGPLPIPIALFFIPMTYFLIVVPAGSIFAIW